MAFFKSREIKAMVSSAVPRTQRGFRYWLGPATTCSSVRPPSAWLRTNVLTCFLMGQNKIYNQTIECRLAFNSSNGFTNKLRSIPLGVLLAFIVNFFRPSDMSLFLENNTRLDERLSASGFRAS